MVVAMDYIFKKYYKKENYRKSYEDRIDFEASFKLDFFVRDNPLYFVFNSYTTNLLDRDIDDSQLNYIWLINYSSSLCRLDI